MLYIKQIKSGSIVKDTPFKVLSDKDEVKFEDLKKLSDSVAVTNENSECVLCICETTLGALIGVRDKDLVTRTFVKLIGDKIHKLYLDVFYDSYLSLCTESTDDLSDVQIQNKVGVIEGGLATVTAADGSVIPNDKKVVFIKKYMLPKSSILGYNVNPM